MRKIEQEMLQAINNRKHWRKDNTEVRVGVTAVRVHLFDNLIATIDPFKGTIRLTDAGYQTITTKSRLNAILQEFNLGGIYSYRRQWKYVYNQKIVDWTGELTLPIVEPPIVTPLDAGFVL